MAIEQTSTITDRTMVAQQHDDRLAAVPYAMAVFRRVVPTGQNGAYGLPTYKLHPTPWTYTIRISDPLLVVDRQKFAMRIAVKEAMTRDRAAQEAAAPTDQEIDAVLDAMFAAGITFDHIRTEAWEDLEKKRRAGTPLAGAISVDVTEGKETMEAAGLPTS